MQLTTGTITFPEELPYSLKESKEGFMKLVLLYAAMKLFEEGKLSLVRLSFQVAPIYVMRYESLL
jgi:hypothetical protein